MGQRMSPHFWRFLRGALMVGMLTPLGCASSGFAFPRTGRDWPTSMASGSFPDPSSMPVAITPDLERLPKVSQPQGEPTHENATVPVVIVSDPIDRTEARTGTRTGDAVEGEQPPELIPLPLESVAAPARAFDYVFEPGDELEVKFRLTPDLNEWATVRPDGMITLQIVGDVMAANRTPEELRASLVHAYTEYLKNPQIVVILRGPAGNHVFVGGEVGSPGRIPILGRLSALQAIIQAGGFRETGDPKRVIVRQENGSFRQINLNCELHHQIAGFDVPRGAADRRFKRAFWSDKSRYVNLRGGEAPPRGPMCGGI